MSFASTWYYEAKGPYLVKEDQTQKQQLTFDPATSQSASHSLPQVAWLGAKWSFPQCLPLVVHNLGEG